MTNNIQFKKFSAEVKAVALEDEASIGAKLGQFEAIVAVFDNVDRAGDRIKSTAFDRTLAAWKASGDPIPVIFSHEQNDPFKHIGFANPEDVKAVPGVGLVVKGTLDIDTNAFAAQIYRLMKRRSLKEFSFGYTVPEGGSTKAFDGATDLNIIDLVEVGPTLKGINERTELLGIKALLEKGEDETLVRKFLAEIKAKQDLIGQRTAIVARAIHAKRSPGYHARENAKAAQIEATARKMLAEKAEGDQERDEWAGVLERESIDFLLDRQ
jgi:HK97 family phage prohead protease